MDGCLIECEWRLQGHRNANKFVKVILLIVSLFYHNSLKDQGNITAMRKWKYCSDSSCQRLQGTFPPHYQTQEQLTPIK